MWWMLWVRVALVLLLLLALVLWLWLSLWLWLWLLLVVGIKAAAQHSCHMLQVRDFKGALLGPRDRVEGLERC